MKSFRNLLPYLRTYRLHMIVVIITTIGLTAMNLVNPWLIRSLVGVIDNADTSSGTQVIDQIGQLALILSGALMLRHLKYEQEANRLEKAVADVIAEGKDVTYDMKERRDDPTAVGTSQMADAIIKKLKV